MIVGKLILKSINKSNIKSIPPLNSRKFDFGSLNVAYLGCEVKNNGEINTEKYLKSHKY